jgi:hypothetical protein
MYLLKLSKPNKKASSPIFQMAKNLNTHITRENIEMPSQAWRHKTVIPELRRQRQEDHEFKDSLGYI